MIWLFVLWIISFEYSIFDWGWLSWVLIVGGFFGSHFLSSYHFKTEYRKLKGIKEDIKSELYGEIYNDLLEELKEKKK